MRITFEVPASDPTRRKESFLESVSDKFPKMVRWFLTAFEREDLDLRGAGLNEARGTVKKLCYPTSDGDSKYNCKGAVYFPHSHYYDTAITEAIQKWNSFLSWREKSKSGKRFPEIESYAPVLDALMFELDLEDGWITLKTGRGKSEIHVPITAPNKSHYDGLNEERISSIRFKEKENGSVFLLTQRSSSPKKPSPSELGENPVLGVDLGERNLASLVAVRPGSQRPEIVDVGFFGGRVAKELEHREHCIRKKLQGRGKSGEIPGRGSKSSDKRKDMCERIAEEIKDKAVEAEAKAVFIGDLKAPRPRNFGSLSRRLGSYPFSRLKEAIKRHLEKADIFAKTIYEGKTKDETGTSQKCHRCGSMGVGDRYKGSFSCPSCGLEDFNADLNASINIAERGLKLLGIPRGWGRYREWTR